MHLIIKFARVGDPEICVEMLNLFAIAVENLGWHTLAGTKKPLGALWPVGVESSDLHSPKTHIHCPPTAPRKTPGAGR